MEIEHGTQITVIIYFEAIVIMRTCVSRKNMCKHTTFETCTHVKMSKHTEINSSSRPVLHPPCTTKKFSACLREFLGQHIVRARIQQCRRCILLAWLRKSIDQHVVKQTGLSVQTSGAYTHYRLDTAQQFHWNDRGNCSVRSLNKQTAWLKGGLFGSSIALTGCGCG